MSTLPTLPRKSLTNFYIIIYITMMVFGVIESVKSVALPAIKLQYGIDYTETGGLISFAWFGYVILCFVVTLILQKAGIKKVLASGTFILIAGCMLTLFASEYFWVMCVLFMVNASFGFFEVGANALAMKIFTTKTALLMSLMHFFYGFGAVLGPYLGSFILNSALIQNLGTGNWRYIYIILSIPIIFLSIYILITKFELVHKSDSPPIENTDLRNQESHDVPAITTDISTVAQNLTFSKVLKIPIVWIFIFMLGFMEVVEFGAANWGPFYLRDVYGFNPSVEGAYFVSIFYFLFTLSRLFGGFLTEKIGYYKSTILCVGMTIFLYLLGFVLKANGIWILTTTGLFIAQFWILLLSLAEKKFKSDAAIVTSVIITLSGFLNGLFQVIIGLTNQYIGNQWGYPSCVIYATIILILGIVFRKQITCGN